jgi:hypothetical protein
MLVLEELEVLADDEGMEVALVHDVERRDGPILPGIAHEELQRGRSAGLRGRRDELDVEMKLGSTGARRAIVPAAPRSP